MAVIYTYKHLDQIPLEDFGFKIHLSATFDNYHRLLGLIRPYLDRKKITYKFVETREDIFHILSAHESGTEVGKLVTIYPKSQSFTAVIEDLYQLLPEGEEGVYILSDRPYKKSNILFYRFGLLKESASSMIDGVPTIVNLEGEVWQDYPKNYFDLPSWVKDIQEPQEEIADSYMGAHYAVSALLYETGGGNIYLAKDKKYDTPVILKETRPHVLSSYDLTKKELREREFNLSLLLKERGVKQVLSPIEAVDEWINTYYIYHYISGETLTDICRSYSLKEYSRQRRTHNLRLFNNFLEIIKQLSKAVLLFHAKGLILNDFHADNFILDDKGSLHFIDLENAYLYEETDIIPIKNDVCLESWNQLDGKQADFHKLGSNILFLLARIRVSEQYGAETNLLEHLLASYKIESNLPEFVDYLMSSHVTESGLKNWLLSLYGKIVETSYVLSGKSDKTEISIPIMDRVKTICHRFERYKPHLVHYPNLPYYDEDAIIRLMKSEQNLGLAGLSGVILMLNSYGLKNLAQIGIDLLLPRLKETSGGLLVPIGRDCYSPYVSDGLAGVIQSLYELDKVKYRRLILKLRTNLISEFAQYEDYNRGMLGIADTLLLTATLRSNKMVKNAIDSLLLNSYIYHKERKLNMREFEGVLGRYKMVYPV